MRQLTVRGVDPQLAQRLDEEARRRGLSKNRTVLALLREALKLTRNQGPREYHDLDHLAGSWTHEEAEEFNKTLKEIRRIEPEMWK